MKLINNILIIILLVFMTHTAFGWRMGRPLTLTYPLDERQVRKLNDVLQDVWNISNGRINIDIVDTARTSSDNGDIWFIVTGPTSYIQYKSQDHVYTVTPNGF